jgi:hypothetical protein
VTGVQTCALPISKLDWKPDRDPAEIGREIIQAKRIAPPLNCSGCHR